MQDYNDIAIPISWPDQTARGDEKWMAFFASIGIVKNLNFRVGHAAVLLIERKTGVIAYFDFGRYLVPRGYGRARSEAFDPRLYIETKANFTTTGNLTNLQAIFDELFAKEQATHGGGRTLFSVAQGISFECGKSYADRLVSEGPILYGALARNNNSCSRFVAQILTAAMPQNDTRRHKILYPESLKASPTSNVVNAAAGQPIFCYEQGAMQQMTMTRAASLRFQLDLLKDNFSKSGAKNLGCDQIPGMVTSTDLPVGLPAQAQWLGGIGEGAWFSLRYMESACCYEIAKYSIQGDLLYTQKMQGTEGFAIDEPFEFTYHFGYNSHILRQHGRYFSFQVVKNDVHLSPIQHINQAIL